jgi:hypothetical protein
MCRTIVGAVLAFALAIAAVFFDTQSWAQAQVIEHGFENAVKEAVPKVTEKRQDWLNQVPKVGEEVGEEVLKEGIHRGVDAFAGCLKEYREDCTNPSK